MAYTQLKNDIAAVIKNNGNQDITGNVLQGTLIGMIDGLTKGYQYMGVATPSTSTTGITDERLFYIAGQTGTYSNMGGSAHASGIGIFLYDGSNWSYQNVPISAVLQTDANPTVGSTKPVQSGGTLNAILTNGSAFDLSAYNSGTTYANLTAALTAMNSLPAAYKKGGMSMKFVRSSDNKYVQYRLMPDEWSTTITDWQGVDDEPTADSNNLVKSGGVKAALKNIMASQINGEYQNITESIDITLTDGMYKTENNTGGISTINQQGLTTIEFNVTVGDVILLKLSESILESLYKNYFIFAKNNSTASVLPSDIPNYIELVDEDEYLWKLTVPPQTTKIFSATQTRYKDIVYAQKLVSSKELKWLLVQEPNLSQSLQDKINGDITPNRIYDDEFIFGSEQYIVQNYTEGGYIASPTTAGGTITIVSNAGIHSAIIPVQEGDVLLVKYGQDISPSSPTARYYYAFGHANNSQISCVNFADYPNYISAYNDTQYLIRIPEGCGYFYLSMQNSYRADDNILFLQVKKNLKWLDIKGENLNRTILNSIYAQTIAQTIAKIKEDEAKYHTWDSICKSIEFSGKTIKFFGDSITYGVCSPNLGNAGNDKYSSTFCRLVGANESNFANSGSCITDSEAGDQYNIGTRVKQYITSSDTIIIIAGGTNDFNTGKQIGTFGDTQRTTLYGSLNDICSYIHTTAPNAVVIFITPIPYTKSESAYPSHIAPLDAYRSAIYDVATEYGYNVVDGKSLGMPREKGNWNNYMCNDYDGLHPTIDGHKLMARNLCGKLL